ncbi:MAG: DUF3347 domain-containing protein [bacterium]|nr:DUF3347 domain-containing protein [bacterium]
MKKITSKILIALTIMLSITACNAQIKNAKTDTIKIYGNCGMCKKAIEKAGNVKKVSLVEWNIDTKMATLTFDTKQTNSAEILKRIALAGYDSDSFLSPDLAYSNLPNCCQYDRTKKTIAKTEAPKMKMDTANQAIQKSSLEIEESNQLNNIFDKYFEVKDALVKTDGALASAKSTALLSAIKAVKMDKLSMDVHLVWMKVLTDLQEDAEHMANTKDASHQREHFIRLSDNIYTLMKVAKYEQSVYYQHCPMANDGKGANWLSKENAIKNPYFGAQMLTCGKTVETIK